MGNENHVQQNPSVERKTKCPGAGQYTEGTAADIVKTALGLAVEAFEDLDAIIVACVHDEIVVETNEDIAEEVARVLERTMGEAARDLLDPVPVEVDVQISDSWSVE